MSLQTLQGVLQQPTRRFNHWQMTKIVTRVAIYSVGVATTFNRAEACAVNLYKIKTRSVSQRPTEIILIKSARNVLYDRRMEGVIAKSNLKANL